MCIHAYVWVCACEGRCPWRPEPLDAPGAGVTGSCESAQQGTKFRSSGRTVSNLNHWALTLKKILIFVFMIILCLFSKKIFVYECLPSYMYVCHIYAWWLQRSEEGIGSSWAGVKQLQAPLCVLGTESVSSAEQQVLSITEPSLQLLQFVCKCCEKGAQFYSFICGIASCCSIICLRLSLHWICLSTLVRTVNHTVKVYFCALFSSTVFLYAITTLWLCSKIWN